MARRRTLPDVACVFLHVEPTPGMCCFLHPESLIALELGRFVRPFRLKYERLPTGEA